MSHRPLPGPAWVWWTVVAVAVAALLALMGWALVNNRTEGEPVGRIDLGAPGAPPGSLALDLGSGDVLHFRIDAVFVTPPGGANERKRNLDTALRASALKVRLTEASGSTREATCAAYVGGGKLGPVLETTIEKSMVTECRLRVTTVGRQTVSAAVTWASGAVPRTSSVQVNVARGGKP